MATKQSCAWRILAAWVAYLALWGTPALAGEPPVASLSPSHLSQDSVNAFLRDYRVLEEGETLHPLGYVVGGEHQRLISGAGDTLYVRGELPRNTRLGIYRQNAPYMAADGTPLGIELMPIGEARMLSRAGEIARVEVLKAYQEVRNNDLLLPLDAPERSAPFQPRPPRQEVAGQIVAVPGGLRFIGRLQVVALDVGAHDGLQPGHLLQVDQQGELIHDPRTQELLQLPATPAGLIMVVRAYRQMSYGLVMQASNVLAVGDAVRSQPAKPSAR